MEKEFDKKLVLENGTEYLGYGFGGKESKVSLLVANTSMAGYQEIISDPSYAEQIIVMTYSVIGNYGISDEDFEAETLSMSGLVVRDYNDMPSYFRSASTLASTLEENGVAGIYGVDTRKLMRQLRDFGSQKAIITDIDTTLCDAMKIINATEISKNLVAKISVKKKYNSRTTHPQKNVVAIDCGIQQSIIRSLNAKGCNVTVTPYNITASEITALKPDGILITSGAGDPKDVKETIETIKELKGKYAIFGIGLGHQIIALAYGADTYKMKLGHRGCNHAVKTLLSDKIEIVNENHGYAVKNDSVKDSKLSVTEIDVLDNTIEALECKEDRTFSVQYYPAENSQIYAKFIKYMEEK